MAYENSVMTACVNFLAIGMGLRGTKYSNALSDTHVLFQSASYKDAGSIATFGFPATRRLFAVLGLTGAEAAQNFLALLSVAGLPATDGTVYADRGAFMRDACRLLGSFFIPANANALTAIGYSLTASNAAPPVDRLASLIYALYIVKKVNPGSFSTSFNYAALRVLLDNFLAFDLARIAYAADVPSTVLPSYKSSISVTGKASLLVLKGNGNINTRSV